MLWKCYTQCVSSGHRTGKGVFIPIPKKGNAKECSNYHTKTTAQLHSRTIAWKIPWTEEPGRLHSIASQRVGHDWATSLSFFLSQLQGCEYFLSQQQESRKSGSYSFISAWCLEARKTDDQAALIFSKLFILFKLDSNLKLPLMRKEPLLAFAQWDLVFHLISSG